MSDYAMLDEFFPASHSVAAPSDYAKWLDAAVPATPARPRVVRLPGDSSISSPPPDEPGTRTWRQTMDGWYDVPPGYEVIAATCELAARSPGGAVGVELELCPDLEGDHVMVLPLVWGPPAVDAPRTTTVGLSLPYRFAARHVRRCIVRAPCTGSITVRVSLELEPIPEPAPEPPPDPEALCFRLEIKDYVRCVPAPDPDWLREARAAAAAEEVVV